jgi:hypothetical protein
MQSDGQFRLRGIFSTFDRARLRYNIHAFAVKTDDVQQVMCDRSFVCHPLVLPGPPQHFTIPLSTKIR